MPDIEERQLGRFTVQIDRLICVGFGDCIDDVSPTPFEFDDEGIATLRSDAGSVDEEALLEACRICPVDALTVLDADGQQLVP